ncbi:MAG TPA: bifunctional alpha/beta hydrolase/class I SAM-dependent methyltransferase [Chthoniobacterales bacterium]|jgi:alpha-beta hydrolase superfamily lysophospholipase
MKATEHTLRGGDGAELFYRAWLPPEKTDKALLLFHRGHEHSGRWQETVEGLGLGKVAIFAWDARGHGHSSGERGAAASVAELARDVESFVSHLAQEHGLARENMIVLAHSLAAVTVTAWVHDYAPGIRAMILVTPAFRVRLYVPFAVPALRLKENVMGPGQVKSYVKAGMLTRDREEAARYQADPMIFRQIAVNLLLDLRDTARRLCADAGALHTPTLLLAAGRDWVVSLPEQRKFFDALSSPIKEMQVYPRALHALFHDLDRSGVVERVRRFVQERFREQATPLSLLTADSTGHTFEEYRHLRNGNGGGLKFAVARAGLRIAGHLSAGVGVGWRSGFDSGLSLDYIYENRARGSLGIGRLIDRAYLETIGWRGIRQRKVHLEKALRCLIEQVHAASGRVHILDIAAGPGRYVIETMADCSDKTISATLCDYREENVEAARILARERKLAGVTAGKADAFDEEALARVRPRANIGIVSGLYELFASNEKVLRSLRGLAAAIEPDGFLIYTNQPWHPQVEFIARVLRNREGDPWVMRRRTTAEIDELVRASGFEKMSMEIDRWGMFTVSVARRKR